MIISGSSTLCTHAWGLLCGRGPYIPHTCGRVCGVLHGILWARICYANAPVPPLAASVLRPQTSPSDSLRGPAYSSLCDSIQGLPRDWPWWFLGGTVIHVKSGHGVDPYLEIPMPKSMKGWWKKWFYLRNDASTPLPVFTGGRPILWRP
jgi:hypothetical protein